jgi:DNA-binding transcriptional LysR family regulator
MYDIDTSLLRSFLTLAETRSFSRTGALIGRSQSAVSAQMRKLESLMGRQLIARDTRNVRLTAEGERLLVHARQMVAAADAMLARFRAGEIAGEVRFGSPEDFASAYLPDMLAEFARAHDKVDLHVSCKLTRQLLAEFADGLQDLVIIKGDPAARIPGAQPLRAETLVWVAAQPLAFHEMAARGRPLPLAMAPAPCVYRERATMALDRAHLPWRGVFISPSFAGVAAAVRAGLGLAVMPQAMVPQGLVTLGPDWPALAAAEICLLSVARPPPAVAALAAQIAAGVGQSRAAL